MRPHSSKLKRTVPKHGSRARQRGFVLMTMAAGAVAIFAALGIAFDLGRTFVAKNELQNYCDSAALAAALQLDGTTTGISNAQTAVTNSANSWNLGTSTVSSPTVTFATSSSGPWSSSPNPATNYSYVKVWASVSVSVYFMPVITANFRQPVNSYAIAAQVAITNFTQGLAPYTAVATNTTPPNFGLTVGNSYTIQWPAMNASLTGFVSNPCAGDQADGSPQEIINYWANANSGYWGSTSNSTIQAEILDVIQLQAVSVGTNIEPILTNGQKQSESGYLDQRANQDISTAYVSFNRGNGNGNISYDPSAQASAMLDSYNSGDHNGRRLLPVPIVLPSSTANTTVVGYGLFLLYANGASSDFYARSTNGNNPYCAVYAGAYNVGSQGTGTGGTTGATYVKLME